MTSVFRAKVRVALFCLVSVGSAASAKTAPETRTPASSSRFCSTTVVHDLARSFGEFVLAIEMPQSNDAAPYFVSTKPLYGHGTNYQGTTAPVVRRGAKVYSLQPRQSPEWNQLVKQSLRAALCSHTARAIVEQAFFADPHILSQVTGLTFAQANDYISDAGLKRVAIPNDIMLVGHRAKILNGNPKAWAFYLGYRDSRRTPRNLFEAAQSFSYASNVTQFSFVPEEITLENFFAAFVHELFIRFDTRFILKSHVFNAHLDALSKSESRGINSSWRENSSVGKLPVKDVKLYMEELILNQAMLAIRSYRIEKSIFQDLNLNSAGQLKALHDEALLASQNAASCHALVRKIGMALLPGAQYYTMLHSARSVFDSERDPRHSLRTHLTHSYVPRLLQETDGGYDQSISRQLEFPRQPDDSYTEEDFRNLFAISFHALKRESTGQGTASLCQEWIKPEISIYMGSMSVGPRPRLSGGGD